MLITAPPTKAVRDAAAALVVPVRPCTRRTSASKPHSALTAAVATAQLSSVLMHMWASAVTPRLTLAGMWEQDRRKAAAAGPAAVEDDGIRAGHGRLEEAAAEPPQAANAGAAGGVAAAALDIGGGDVDDGIGG